jgi:hypothetical protein
MLIVALAIRQPICAVRANKPVLLVLDRHPCELKAAFARRI